MGDRRLYLVLAFALASLVGCYRYNGETYSSQDAAFAAQGRLLDGIIAKIPRLAAPLAPVVRVGIPSREAIAQHAFVSPPSSSYGTELLGREFDVVTRAVRARGLFQHVLPFTTSGQHVEPAQGEAVLYLYLPSPNVAGWYFSLKPGARTAVLYDNGEADRAARVMFFLQMIENELRSAAR